MNTHTVQFGEWLPDQMDLRNPGTTTAKNALPHAMGWRPWPSLEVFSDALTAYCRGTFYARAKDDAVHNYAGDATKLYELSNDTWSDVTRSAGGNYSLSSGERWDFTQWGEKIIAVCGVNQASSNNPQIITMGGANFADLSGSPPQARYCATVRNFVVFANTWDSSDGLVPNRVRWSGINDETAWTVSAATQADKEDLQTGGWVEQIFGGEYGVVLSQHSVHRMTYAGTPVIWQFDEVLPGLGLLAPHSAAQYGDHIFFLSQNGFQVITNGSSAQAIGAQKVDDLVLGDLDTGELGRVVSTIDVPNRRYYMAYPGADATGGLANRVVAYDWSLNRWGYAEFDVQDFLRGMTTGYTLDGLDSVSSSIDALVPSLDDRRWTGDVPALGVFNSDNKLAYVTGSPMAAVLETLEQQLRPGRRSMVSNIRPLVTGTGTTTVQVGYRQVQDTAPTWTTAASVNARGRANVRKNARYHRFRLNLSGDWEYAQGVDVESSAAGWR